MAPKGDITFLFSGPNWAELDIFLQDSSLFELSITDRAGVQVVPR